MKDVKPVFSTFQARAIKLVTTVAALAVIMALHAGAASAAPTIEKTLTNTTGANNFNPVQVGGLATTTYEFTITYTSDGAGAVTILDTIPAEFTNVVVDDGFACSALTVEKKGSKQKGATKIRCSLPAATDATLIVTFQTRQSPGKGHDPAIFAPTSCEPLFLNDGAVAVLSSDLTTIVAGPTAGLYVQVDDLTSDLDGDGVGDACDAAPTDPSFQ